MLPINRIRETYERFTTRQRSRKYSVLIFFAFLLLGYLIGKMSVCSDAEIDFKALAVSMVTPAAFTIADVLLSGNWRRFPIVTAWVAFLVGAGLCLVR